MIKPEESDFRPDWSSAPGETIADILEERRLSVMQFAQGIKYTAEQAGELLAGRTPITAALAKRLELVVGGSVTFWINREYDYRRDLARLAGEEKRRSDENWVKELPIKEMVSFGWVKPDPGHELVAILRFFNVPNVRCWRAKYQSRAEIAAFRTSPTFESDAACVAAWLRQGEVESASINCKGWDPTSFKNILPTIRVLTRERDPQNFIPKLRNYCAQCGVAAVVLPAPKGCRASGATYFLSPDKALLLLSFRYLSDDHFWFTFFHEAGHLLLHGKSALFLEGVEILSAEKENEANDFAARLLIPEEFKASMLRLPLDGIQVIRFARSVGVSPGIVVGQLQHYGRFTRRQLNNLKRRFVWKND
jgi:HTH-type transcriptional regulator / antitoxin HigA